MSKRPAKSSSNKPIVPQVSIDTWKRLLAAAREFQELAPWEWMHDSHVIGLRHPATKEVLLGSVLGRLRSVFALLIYRNETGRRWLLNTILNDGDSGGLEDEDTAFEQDLVKAEFVLKSELLKEDKSILAACAFSPAKKNGPAWPQFRSLVPGGYPWHLTQDEAETHLFALPRVTAVARLMRDHPETWNDHPEGDIAFVPDNFDPATGELRAEQLEWQPMIPPPEPPPQLVAFDDATVSRLVNLPSTQGFHLQLDLAYAPFPVTGPNRPRFPKLAMAVDGSSGLIGGFQLSDSDDRDGAEALGTVLCDALAQTGRRPEAIHVQRPRVAEMLSKAGSNLSIPIRLVDELGALNFARQSMEQQFGGGR